MSPSVGSLIDDVESRMVHLIAFASFDYFALLVDDDCVDHCERKVLLVKEMMSSSSLNLLPQRMLLRRIRKAQKASGALGVALMLLMMTTVRKTDGKKMKRWMYIDEFEY